MSARNERLLHPMDSFGVVSGLAHEIRVDRLRDRHRPLIPFPHKHSFYQLIVVTRGSGWHEIDFRRHRVRVGTVFLMKPAQVHSWALSKDADGFVVEFEDDVLSAPEPAFRAAAAAARTLPDSFTLSPTLAGTVAALAGSLRRMTGKPVADVLNQAALTTLLLLFQRDAGGVDVSSSPDSAAGDFRALIEKHFRREHAVSFYARALRMTPKALTMRVKRATGRAARDLIQERALLEAKRLLAYSDFSVSAVADELGFEDPNYFTRFFRGKAGLTPAAFRRRARASRGE